MKLQEVLKIMGLKKLPKEVPQTPERCIAKVIRKGESEDYAIVKDGKVICDKGYRMPIAEIKAYYLDETKEVESHKSGEDKLSELQKMAERSRLEKLGQELADDRVLEIKSRSFIMTADEELSEQSDEIEIGDEVIIEEEAVVVRPTEYKGMIAYITEHKLTEEKTFGMSKVRAEEIISDHFNK